MAADCWFPKGKPQLRRWLVCVYLPQGGVILVWELPGSVRLREASSLCLGENEEGCFRGSSKPGWRGFLERCLGGMTRNLTSLVKNSQCTLCLPLLKLHSCHIACHFLLCDKKRYVSWNCNCDPTTPWAFYLLCIRKTTLTSAGV